MKKLILIMAATVISSVAANAQQRVQRTAEERASMQTQQLSKKLSLSEDQQKKIQEINLTSAKNMDELRAQSEGDRAEAFKGAKKIEEDKETAYKGVLTEKQMADYMTLKAEREKKMKERMQQRKGGWDKSKKDSI